MNVSLNLLLKTADITVAVGSFGKYCGGDTMDGIQEIDAVLQFVRQAAQQFHVPSDAAITQQILLFGDSFYGYRFTTIGFTAIWSATDQTLKMFDPEGQIMEIFSLSKNTAGTSLESISMPLLQRRAA